MSEREDLAEQSVETLVEFLEGRASAYDIRTHQYTVDFTIGDPALWPSNLREDELSVIRSSSVSFGGLQPYKSGDAVSGNPQTGSNIHLPPARENVWDELKESAGLPEQFSLVNGSFRLGTLLPPPNGICTPHVIITEDAPLSHTIDAVEECLRLYQSVYDGGDEVIKQQP